MCGLLMHHLISQQPLERVSHHMGHSTSTAEKYYQNKVADSRSLEAFNTVKEAAAANTSVSVEEYFASDHIKNLKTPNMQLCRPGLPCNCKS